MPAGFSADFATVLRRMVSPPNTCRSFGVHRRPLWRMWAASLIFLDPFPRTKSMQSPLDLLQEVDAPALPCYGLFRYISSPLDLARPPLLTVETRAPCSRRGRTRMRWLSRPAQASGYG